MDMKQWINLYKAGAKEPKNAPVTNAQIATVFHDSQIEKIAMYNMAGEQKSKVGEVSVKLSPEQVPVLTAIAKGYGMSRSELIRNAVDFYLTFHPLQANMMLYSQDIMSYTQSKACT